MVRIMHTADWHLGRSLYGQSLIEDQKYVLNQLVDAASQANLDAVVIAGDIFDRAVPPVAAVELFDQVLTCLIDELELAVLFVAGNHDSPKRLGYGSSLLARSRCHVAANLTVSSTINQYVVTLHDKDGPVQFALAPYAEFGAIKAFAKSQTKRSRGLQNGLQKGLKKVERVAGADDSVNSPEATETQRVFGKNRSHKQSLEWLIRSLANQCSASRTILVAHAHVEGGKFGDSERLIPNFADDLVSLQCLQSFNYTALGHLHQPQWLTDNIRYSGSILKYSFTEVHDQKSLTIIDLDKHGSVQSELVNLSPKFDMQTLDGHFHELMSLGESIQANQLAQTDIPIPSSQLDVTLSRKNEVLHVTSKVSNISLIEQHGADPSNEWDASTKKPEFQSQFLIDDLLKVEFDSCSSPGTANLKPPCSLHSNNLSTKSQTLVDTVMRRDLEQSLPHIDPQNYLRITLFDEGPILEAAHRLRRYFPRLLHLRRRLVKSSATPSVKSPFSPTRPSLNENLASENLASAKNDKFQHEIALSHGLTIHTVESSTQSISDTNKIDPPADLPRKLTHSTVELFARFYRSVTDKPISSEGRTLIQRLCREVDKAT